MLGSHLELIRPEPDVLEVRNVGTGRSWTLAGTIDSWARHADHLNEAGVECGMGWPDGSGAGVALLALYIDETISSTAMGLAETRLLLGPRGIYAE